MTAELHVAPVLLQVCNDVQITEYQTQCNMVTNMKTKCDIVFAQKCDKVSDAGGWILVMWPGSERHGAHGWISRGWGGDLVAQHCALYSTCSHARALLGE